MQYLSGTYALARGYHTRCRVSSTAQPTDWHGEVASSSKAAVLSSGCNSGAPVALPTDAQCSGLLKLGSMKIASALEVHCSRGLVIKHLRLHHCTSCTGKMSTTGVSSVDVPPTSLVRCLQALVTEPSSRSEAASRRESLLPFEQALAAIS